MDIGRIRRENLEQLIDVFGGPTALANKLKYANGTYLSQLVGPRPKRNLGERAARTIEERLDLPAGWMDHPGASMTFKTPADQAAPNAVIDDGVIKRGRRPALRVVPTDGTFDFKGATQPAPPPGAKDLPVYGAVRGSFEGEEIDYHNPIEYTERPAALAGLAKACAVFVTGDSMEPRYYAGEILLVHPHMPPRLGDWVVVELTGQRGLIKRLVRRGDEGVTVAQLNPAEERLLPRREVVGIYKVIGSRSET